MIVASGASRMEENPVVSRNCGQCGSGVADDARFCAACGSPAPALAPATEGREVRKVVTVLFADVSGSTKLGEQLDPEAVRSLLGRHFAKARAILERHGGTVEKFIGDAVMAVFGVPVAHEDDALRAVRAATDLLNAIEQINADPMSPSRVAIRIGVNTGEVVTGAGSGETLVTGDAVNTAARLEQAADPGTILIGPDTLALVRDAVETEPVEPIAAKGKADAVRAARVIRLVGDSGRRRTEDAPLIGREDELAMLTAELEHVLEQGTMRLVTVLAPAGVGKSRLVREFATPLVATATTLKGRCLPYGDGITYWPMREVIHQLADIDESQSPGEVRDRLALLLDEGTSVEPLAALVGLDAPPQRHDELFWSTRRVLERASAIRPLLVVIEDLHWAEDTLLDLLEYLATSAVGPILVAATARPELLDRRPGWSGAGSVIGLDALDNEAADTLLVNQPGGGVLPRGIRNQVVAAADGNPLFLEEMMAMLREGGTLREREGTWHLQEAPTALDIPPSIQALLAARLDQLQVTERNVLQHGSVIGRTFEAAAVADIGSDEVADRLAQVLIALVRRELIRPERADVTDGDAYRFRHILIRDAAYQALAKADRARLHERFAVWLEGAAGARIGEYEDILAHHLERAFRYREELGENDLDGLRRSAAEWALRAGRRAQARDDSSAAIALLRSAVVLAHGMYEIEVVALRTLAGELGHTSEFDERDGLIRRELEIARDAGDDREVAWALVFRILLHRNMEPASWVEEAHREGPEAIQMLEAAGDDAGLAAAWHAMSLAAWPDNSASAAATERALHHARLAKDPRMLGWPLVGMTPQLLNDETPVSEALPIVESIAREAGGLGRLFASIVAADLAVLEAMAGRYDDALARIEVARATLREFNYHSDLAASATRLTMVHELGGHLDRAEAPLRESIEFLESVRDLDLGPYQTSILARCLAWQGREDEVTVLIVRAQVDDVDPMREVFCRAARSHVLSATGNHAGAVEEARRAVDGMLPEWPTRRGLILLDLARALYAAGRSDEARAALNEARALAVRKGNIGLEDLIDQQYV